MNCETTTIMLKALDGLAARAVVTAQNIANAGTPGYRPMRLTFEQALKDAAGRGGGAIQQLTPTLERMPAGTAQSELRTDLELATANSTTLRYGALIEVLTRQLDIEALAITGNG